MAGTGMHRSTVLRVLSVGPLAAAVLLGSPAHQTVASWAPAKTTCGAGDAGYVRAAKGSVETRSHKGTWHATEANARLHAGDEVRTRSSAVASVHLCAGGNVYLNQKSDVTVSDKRSARVNTGESVAVFKQSSALIETKAVKAHMTGTHRATLDIQAGKSQTVVTAAEGTGQVTAKHGSVAINPDQQTRVAADGKPKKPVTVDATTLTTWTSRLTWSVVAQLGNDQPTKLAVDSQGNIYVAEEFGGHILKLSSAGKVLATWGSPGSGPGQFGRPRGVAVDASGNIYVADAGNDDIVKLSPNGQQIAVWGTYGSEPGQFNFPSGIAVDPTGNIYVADTGNSRIQKLSSSGEPLAQWGEEGLQLGQLRDPEGVTLDAAGNIYVADWGDADFFDRVIKLSPTGSFLAQWGGTQGNGIGQFGSPYDIAVDPSGTLYVAETGNARVQELSSADGHSLGILGTHGSGVGQFDYGDPTGLAVDRNGNLYTAEEGNHRIEKYTP